MICGLASEVEFKQKGESLRQILTQAAMFFRNIVSLGLEICIIDDVDILLLFCSIHCRRSQLQNQQIKLFFSVDSCVINLEYPSTSSQ